ERLDDIALFEVVVVREPDPALKVLLYLALVVTEAAQRVDPIGRDHLAAPPDASARAADDSAIGHEGAGDDRALADAEDLAHLRPALDHLYLLRLEQALQGRVDVVRELVDDVVGPNVHALGLGGPPGRVGEAGVEAH